MDTEITLKIISSSGNAINENTHLIEAIEKAERRIKRERKEKEKTKQAI